jgi:hypothetical protein
MARVGISFILDCHHIDLDDRQLRIVGMEQHPVASTSNKIYEHNQSIRRTDI